MRRRCATAGRLCCRTWLMRGASTMEATARAPVAGRPGGGGAQGEDVLDLGRGWPSHRLLPQRAVASAAAAATTEATLHYAPAQGDVAFRRAVASLIDAATPRTEARPAPARVSADAIMLTAGASNGLALAALASQSRPGDVCLVESATYWFAHAILQDAGFVLDAVPRHQGGLDLQELARKLAHPRVRALYLVHMHARRRSNARVHVHNSYTHSAAECAHACMHARVCTHARTSTTANRCRRLPILAAPRSPPRRERRLWSFAARMALSSLLTKVRTRALATVVWRRPASRCSLALVGLFGSEYECGDEFQSTNTDTQRAPSSVRFFELGRRGVCMSSCRAWHGLL